MSFKTFTIAHANRVFDAKPESEEKSGAKEQAGVPLPFHLFQNNHSSRSAPSVFGSSALVRQQVEVIDLVSEQTKEEDHAMQVLRREAETEVSSPSESNSDESKGIPIVSLAARSPEKSFPLPPTTSLESIFSSDSEDGFPLQSHSMPSSVEMVEKFIDAFQREADKLVENTKKRLYREADAKVAELTSLLALSMDQFSAQSTATLASLRETEAMRKKLKYAGILD